MTRWSRFTLRKWVLIVLAIQLLGCESRTTQRRGAEDSGETPRARFGWIMEQFKRHCSGSSILVPTSTGDNLVLRFVVDDVSYEVDGGDLPGAPCTATMTIKTSTHYALLAGSPATPDDTPRRRLPAAGPPSGPSDASQEEQAPLRRMTAEELLGSKSQGKTETYQFAFEQGRWVLKTEEVDPSIREPLVLALRRQ